MGDYNEIAIAAIREMFTKVEPDYEFPSDAIWQYAEEEIPSSSRSPIVRMLSREGFIEDTGQRAKTVTQRRRSTITTKYRFGPALLPKTTVNNADISDIVSKFVADCNGALLVSHTQSQHLCVSLLTKRFLILTGLAGSGKTKLAQAFARWITPVEDPSPYYALVPVGADWTGNENIVGYPDGLDGTAYSTRPALELMRHALEPAHAQVPHFLILDEMNLSHVERYFADLLSAIESGEPIPLYDGKQRKAGQHDVPQRLRLPDNLFIIGTVNVDETTYMFSPKVLDRANVIEFRMEPAELTAFLDAPKAPRLDQLDGKGQRFGSSFVAAAADRAREVPSAIKAEYQQEMLLFFNLLREHNAEFGYRTGYEAARFLHFYQLLGGYAETDTAWFKAAMDAVIVQKLLPKLHGSRSRLEGLLWALGWTCGEEHAGRYGKPFAAQLREASTAQNEAIYSPEVVEATLQKAGKEPRYPLSFAKIVRMWRKLVREQFVSFSEA